MARPDLKAGGTPWGGLAALYMVVFIDLLGFSMIIPLMPYYARNYGASDTSTGLLLASYAAAQFLGAPLIGRLSDRYGRRPLIVASLAGTCASFVLLGFARSLPALFASRILCGLFGGNIAVAQAYIADVTDSRHRAKALGFIGAAVGLGFVIGPAVGALLSRRSFEDPAFAAALLSFVDLAAVVLWLPEPPAHPHHGRLLTVRTAAAALAAALRRPLVGPLLWTRFAFFVPFAMFQTIFPLYAIHRFGLSAAATGWIFTYIGVLIVVVQGVAIGRLTERFEEHRLMLAGVGLMAASLLWWAAAPSLALMLAGFIPLALAGGTFNTVNNSLLSKAVEAHEVGGMLGMSSSVESLTRVIGPSLGGLLLEHVGTHAPGLFGGVVLAALWPYTWWRLGRPGRDSS